MQDTKSGFSTLDNLKQFADLWGWYVDQDNSGQIIIYTNAIAEKDGNLRELTDKDIENNLGHQNFF